MSRGWLTTLRRWRPFLETRLFSVLLLLSIGGGVALAVMLNTNAVLVKDAGQVKEAFTLKKNADEILNVANILVSEQDEINFSGFGDGQAVLEINRAFSVQVKADDEIKTITMTQDTVESALSLAGVVVEEGDKVTPELSTVISRNADIVVLSAKEITIRADGQEIRTKATGKTVADVLQAAGVEISEDDVVSEDLEEAARDGMTITVGRVRYETVERTEQIPYQTIEEQTDALLKGETEVAQQGIVGQKKCSYKCKFIDETLVSETLLSETVLNQPVDQRVLIGTKKPQAATEATTQREPATGAEKTEDKDPEDKENDTKKTTAPSKEEATKSPGPAVNAISQLTPPASLELNDKGIPVSYTNKIVGSATAYGPSAGTHTATGKAVKPGYVAVNPKVIPYGTKLYIVSADGRYVYGYASAEDTGGAAMNNTIVADLYFATDGECFAFGRRDIVIYVLD